MRYEVYETWLGQIMLFVFEYDKIIYARGNYENNNCKIFEDIKRLKLGHKLEKNKQWTAVLVDESTWEPAYKKIKENVGEFQEPILIADNDGIYIDNMRKSALREFTSS